MHPTREDWERKVGGWPVAMIYAPKTLQTRVRFVKHGLKPTGLSGAGLRADYFLTVMTGSAHGYKIRAKRRGVGCIQFPVQRYAIKMCCERPISSTRKL
jgi:hypothetical protein